MPRYPATPGPPPVVQGVQPEIGDKLQCLMCGSGFSQLGQHVVAKHKISADDYRARFGLPATRGLHSSRIRQARAVRGRAQWQSDPQVRLRLQPTRTTAQERIAKSTATRRATLSRPGVRAAGKVAGQVAHRAWLATVDSRLTHAAVAAGFRGLAAMLAATADLAAHDVARIVNVSTRRIQTARRRHLAPYGAGQRQCQECNNWYRGLGQHISMAHGLTMTEYRRRHPLDAHGLERQADKPRPQPPGRDPLSAAQLAALAPGEQPQDGTGRRACRECGHWYRSIGHHVAAAHHLPTAEYRRRHKIGGTGNSRAPSRTAPVPDPWDAASEERHTKDHSDASTENAARKLRPATRQ